MAARRLRVHRPVGPPVSVKWHPGTSDSAMEQSIRAACGLSPGATIELTDAADGAHLAINEFLPDGLVANLALLEPPLSSLPPLNKTEDWLDLKNSKSVPTVDENVPLLGAGTSDGDGGGDPGTGKGSGFQKQLLKFDRLNAHLANERTWLAWIRTAMSLLTLAFTLQTEAADADKTSWSKVLFITGCLTIGAVEVTYFTGWVRYSKVKDILAVNMEDLTPKMGRLKLKYQTHFVFVVLVLIAFVYWFGGYDDF